MPGSRQEFFKEIMHFHYMTYMAMPQHKILCPRVHEIYNFGRYLLVYRYYILNLSEPCFFINNISFTLFTPELPPFGVGVMKYTISCFLLSHSGDLKIIIFKVYRPKTIQNYKFV